MKGLCLLLHESFSDLSFMIQYDYKYRPKAFVDNFDYYWDENGNLFDMGKIKFDRFIKVMEILISLYYKAQERLVNGNK